MTRDRPSEPTKPNRPPDREGDACVATATDVAERPPSSQIPFVTIARSSLGAVDACPLPSGMSRWCISKGCPGIQHP
jgi:hypothetical protein